MVKEARTKTLHLTNPLTRGPNVARAQELLKKHGYFKARVDSVFGPATANACKRAKYQLGYATKDIKPTYGDPLDGLLAGTIKLPLAYKARKLARRRKAHNKAALEQRLRAKIVSNAKWMLGKPAKEHEFYAQRRPIDGEHTPFRLPLYFDCSGAITDCYSWAKVGSKRPPDPNDEGYNGLGYTGTLLNSMHHITAEEIEPGDVGVYGLYPGKHAVLALTHGPDPIVFSMGHAGDPNQYRASALHEIGPLQWLTLRKW